MTAETSMRGRFGFQLAAPSFLFPADWETNVRATGPLMDEVELLFFDSSPAENLPSPAVIAGLAALSRETGVSYNIHLPSDISPVDTDPDRRAHAAEVLRHLVRMTERLYPTAYTLHLPYTGKDTVPATVGQWQQGVQGFLSGLLGSLEGALPPEILTIENLDYPPEWVWEATIEAGVGCCLDVGHLWLQGGSLRETFSRYRENIRLIHLHGVDQHRDHRALSVLDTVKRREVIDILKDFSGTVSIEVFNHLDFWDSVGWLTDALGDSTVNGAGRHAADCSG